MRQGALNQYRPKSSPPAAMICFEREQVPTRCGRGPAAVRLGCGFAALGTARHTPVTRGTGFLGSPGIEAFRDVRAALYLVRVSVYS
jgi:hypothetical protein